MTLFLVLSGFQLWVVSNASYRQPGVITYKGDFMAKPNTGLLQFKSVIPMS